MNDVICQACGLYKECTNPKVQGEIGFSEIKYVLVLPYPEMEDEAKKGQEPFQGRRAKLVKDKFKDVLPECYITYLLKCPQYKDPSNRRAGYREPTDLEIKQCTKHLVKELKMFPNAKIMTFGTLVLKTISKNPDAKISQYAGRNFGVTIAGNEYRVHPNYDPGQVLAKPNYESDFSLFIQKMVSGEQQESTENRTKLLKPAEAIEEIRRVRQLYKDGKIEYVVFDTETSVALEPWGGGEIIMVSLCHTESRTGYAIPLVVNNKVEYKAVNDDDSGKVPWKAPFPDGIEAINFEVTEKEKFQIKKEVGLMLEEVPIGGQNLKYDTKWIGWHQWCDVKKIRVAFDTLNDLFQYQSSGQGIDNSLKGACRKFFNVTDDWEDNISKYLSIYKLNKEKHFGNIPTSILWPYAALDSYWNLRLREHMVKIMEPEMLKTSAMVTSAIIPFTDTELRGMHVDDKTLNYLEKEYNRYLVRKRGEIDQLPVVGKLTQKYIQKVIDENKGKKKPLTHDEMRLKAFNLNNPVKVSELVYDKPFYGLKHFESIHIGYKYRKPVTPISEFQNESGSYSTDKDMRKFALKELLSEEALKLYTDKSPLLGVHVDTFRECREFIKKYHDYKRISKLLNDYVYAFPNSMFQGIYKPQFNLNGTITGRLSSPFHSMPKGCDIKRIIASRWAEIGGLVLAVDYSQLEYRIIAAISNELSLINMFKAGIDAHTGTACGIFNLPPDQITKEMRGIGKAINFGMLYGKTDQALAEDIGRTLAEAKQFKSDFFDRAPTLKTWMTNQEEEVLKQGFVRTKFGRKIPVVVSPDAKESEIAEAKRFAVNYLIQSSASDIVLNFVMDVWYAMQEAALKSSFLATVHDSSEYDVYPGELFVMAQTIKKYGQEVVMEKYPWLTCPLVLDFEIGTSWGGALKGEIEDLSDSHLVFKTSSTQKDIKQFIRQASKAYDVQCEITSEKILTDEEMKKEFKDDVFFKDRVQQSVVLTLRSKSS